MYKTPTKFPLTDSKFTSSRQKEGLQKYKPSEKHSESSFNFNFLSYRSAMKSVYKNKNYKVITKEGELIPN